MQPKLADDLLIHFVTCPCLFFVDAGSLHTQHAIRYYLSFENIQRLESDKHTKRTFQFAVHILCNFCNVFNTKVSSSTLNLLLVFLLVFIRTDNDKTARTWFHFTLIIMTYLA